MSTTFDPALSTSRDWLRFKMTDTADTPAVPDSTYDSLILKFGVKEAGYQMAKYFEAKYATLPDWKEADVSETLGEKARKFFQDLASEMRNPNTSYPDEISPAAITQSVMVSPDLTNYRLD